MVSRLLFFGVFNIAFKKKKTAVSQANGGNQCCLLEKRSGKTTGLLKEWWRGLISGRTADEIKRKRHAAESKNTRQSGCVTPPPTVGHSPLHAFYAQNLKHLIFSLNTKRPYVFPRWTGKATAAWSRNCPPFVRMKRMMKSSSPYREHLAHLCVLPGGSAHPCAHPFCRQGPFVPPLITAARPHFRYLWSASVVPLQNSVPGARTSHTQQFFFFYQLCLHAVKESLFMKANTGRPLARLCVPNIRGL